MTFKQVDDLQTPIGDVLQAVTRDGLVLESGGKPRFALLPLDDELIDYLVEHSPKFIEVCEGIRERMQAGRFHTHEEVKRSLGLTE
jgi:hypothetical protein